MHLLNNSFILLLVKLITFFQEKVIIAYQMLVILSSY